MELKKEAEQDQASPDSLEDVSDKLKTEPVLCEQEHTGSPYLLPSSMSPCMSGERRSGNSPANLTKCESENKSLCIKTTEGETITFPESFQYCVVKQEPQDWDESQTNNPNRQILLWKNGFSGDRSEPVHFMEGQNEQTSKSMESVSDNFGTKLVNPQETISSRVSRENCKIKEEPGNPSDSSLRESGKAIRGNNPEKTLCFVQPTVLYLQTEQPQRETKLGRKTIKIGSINPVERNDGFTKFRLIRPYPSSQSNEQDISDLLRPFPCKLCGKRFKLKAGLKKHLKIHSGDRPFQCNLCEKRFLTKNVLHNHIMTHTGERPHKCNLCEKRFIYISDLRRHTLTHTGETPFECNICQKQFRVSSTLKNHMLIHTGERPHKCNICEKPFRYRSALSKHILTHTGEKPHCCMHCDKRFTQLHHLHRHMVCHTKEKL